MILCIIRRVLNNINLFINITKMFSWIFGERGASAAQLSDASNPSTCDTTAILGSKML